MATKNEGSGKMFKDYSHKVLWIALGLIGALVLLSFSSSALDTGWRDPSTNTGEFYQPTNAYHNDSLYARGNNYTYV